MLKIFLSLIIVVSFSLSSTTFGLFSEKLGTDFFNFSLKLYEKDDNEFFASIGPSIALPVNLGIGWKKYYRNRGIDDINNNKIIIPFSCISIFKRYANKMAVTNGSSVREDTCIGLSGGLSVRPFKKDVYINLGFFGSYDFRNHRMILPFLNIEYYLFSKDPLFK
tara:strand:+ start:3054 stop:3548 length:495 start_codon:yes stop_codon:yes gene_type:complete